MKNFSLMIPLLMSSAAVNAAEESSKAF